MYTDEFEYYRAASIDEAISLLGEHRGARVLAGGHGVLTRMKVGEESPPALVDISGVEGLHDVSVTDDSLSIGALCSHADVAGSKSVKEHATALADAAGTLGDLQVRNGGTIGGNLAHGDSRSDPPAAALALDAVLTVRGPDGERTVVIGDLFEGDFRTSLGAHDVVTTLQVPIHADAASAFVRRRSPLSGYASTGVAVRLRTDGESITDARVAATGAPPHPVRLRGVENALEGESLTGDIATDAAAHAMDELDAGELRSDVAASGEYRAHLLGVYTERAIETTIARGKE